MRRVDVFTLVPEAFGWFLAQHPVAEAIAADVLSLGVHNIRDYTFLSHKQVDDTPFGGGPGMVIRVDVVAAALEGVFGAAAEQVRLQREVILLTPGGRPFDEQVADELAAAERDLVLLCGRYEGFDFRVSELLASSELSLGPFVLAGGEVAAMAVIEAIARKLPGVLGNEESPVVESFSAELDGAVEYPQYTRPREFRGLEVPEVLLSGNHGAVERWRRERARPSRWVEWARSKLHSES
jgi:tRNA (guanine37-N1)-methyltransferase